MPNITKQYNATSAKEGFSGQTGYTALSSVVMDLNQAHTNIYVNNIKTIPNSYEV